MTKTMFGIIKFVGDEYDNTTEVIAVAYTREEAEEFKVLKEQELVKSLEAQKLVGDFCAEWEAQHTSPVIDYSAINLVNIYAPENMKLNLSYNAEQLKEVKKGNLAKIQKAQQPLVEFHEAKKLALDAFKVKINPPVDYEWASYSTTFDIQEIPVVINGEIE